VKSVREYPCKLKYFTNPSCRLHENQAETLHHLLEDCTETKYYYNKYDILSKTFTYDMYSSILAISKFDCWLYKIIDYNIKLPSYRVLLVISNLKRGKMIEIRIMKMIADLQKEISC